MNQNPEATEAKISIFDHGAARRREERNAVRDYMLERAEEKRARKAQQRLQTWQGAH